MDTFVFGMEESSREHGPTVFVIRWWKWSILTTQTMLDSCISISSMDLDRRNIKTDQNILGNSATEIGMDKEFCTTLRDRYYYRENGEEIGFYLERLFLFLSDLLFNNYILNILYSKTQVNHKSYKFFIRFPYIARYSRVLPNIISFVVRLTFVSLQL